MDKKFTLLLAGVILLIVASVMGEGGPVDSIAKIDSADTQQFQNTVREQSEAEPAASFADTQSGGQWFAAGQPPQPTIPVYENKPVHIEVPQQVVDPKLVAASPIK